MRRVDGVMVCTCMPKVVYACECGMCARDESVRVLYVCGWSCESGRVAASADVCATADCRRSVVDARYVVPQERAVGRGRNHDLISPQLRASSRGRRL